MSKSLFLHLLYVIVSSVKEVQKPPKNPPRKINSTAVEKERRKMEIIDEFAEVDDELVATAPNSADKNTSDKTGEFI